MESPWETEAKQANKVSYHQSSDELLIKIPVPASLLITVIALFLTVFMMALVYLYYSSSTETDIDNHVLFVSVIALMLTTTAAISYFALLCLVNYRCVQCKHKQLKVYSSPLPNPFSLAKTIKFDAKPLAKHIREWKQDPDGPDYEVNYLLIRQWDGSEEVQVTEFKNAGDVASAARRINAFYQI